MASVKHTLKKGDLLEIIANDSKHGYATGDIVEIVSNSRHSDDCYNCIWNGRLKYAVIATDYKKLPHRFSVGDIVEIVSVKHGHKFPIGELVTVTALNIDMTYGPSYTGKSNDSAWGFTESEIVAYDENKIRKGDYVITNKVDHSIIGHSFKVDEVCEVIGFNEVSANLESCSDGLKQYVSLKEITKLHNWAPRLDDRVVLSPKSEYFKDKTLQNPRNHRGTFGLDSDGENPVIWDNGKRNYYIDDDLLVIGGEPKGVRLENEKEAEVVPIRTGMNVSITPGTRFYLDKDGMHGEPDEVGEVTAEDNGTVKFPITVQWKKNVNYYSREDLTVVVVEKKAPVPPTKYKTKVGDHVKIHKASRYYGINSANPKDLIGVVHESSDFVIKVTWPNNTRNVYEKDGDHLVVLKRS